MLMLHPVAKTALTQQPVEYLIIPLGQFTRNYTQTTKQGLLTTNKG